MYSLDRIEGFMSLYCFRDVQRSVVEISLVTAGPLRPHSLEIIEKLKLILNMIEEIELQLHPILNHIGSTIVTPLLP